MPNLFSSLISPPCQKGAGYHLDLFWVAILIIVCSFMGLPWYVAATVISIAHIDSLKMETETSAPGEQPKFLGVRWDQAEAFCFHPCLWCRPDKVLLRWKNDQPGFIQALTLSFINFLVCTSEFPPNKWDGGKKSLTASFWFELTLIMFLFQGAKSHWDPCVPSDGTLCLHGSDPQGSAPSS